MNEALTIGKAVGRVARNFAIAGSGSWVGKMADACTWITNQLLIGDDWSVVSVDGRDFLRVDENSVACTGGMLKLGLVADDFVAKSAFATEVKVGMNETAQIGFDRARIITCSATVENTAPVGEVRGLLGVALVPATRVPSWGTVDSEGYYGAFDHILRLPNSRIVKSGQTATVTCRPTPFDIQARGFWELGSVTTTSNECQFYLLVAERDLAEVNPPTVAPSQEKMAVNVTLSAEVEFEQGTPVPATIRLKPKSFEKKRREVFDLSLVRGKFKFDRVHHCWGEWKEECSPDGQIGRFAYIPVSMLDEPLVAME